MQCVNGSARRTSWMDQLDRPARDQFFLFEVLASSHIRRFSFQFIHCRSFRVRRRPCSFLKIINQYRNQGTPNKTFYKGLSPRLWALSGECFLPIHQCCNDSIYFTVFVVVSFFLNFIDYFYKKVLKTYSFLVCILRYVKFFFTISCDMHKFYQVISKIDLKYA